MASESAVSILVCVLLAAVFYGPWQWVCTDWMRQTCFEARDKIFDLAADGRIAFASAEYRAIRKSVEAEIRFAHQLTLPYLIVVGLGIRWLRPSMVTDAKVRDREIRARLEPDVRLEIETILAVMNRKILLLLMLKSPLLVALPVVVLVPVYMCFAAAKAYARVVAGAVNSIIRITSSLGGSDSIVPHGSW